MNHKRIKSLPVMSLAAVTAAISCFAAVISAKAIETGLNETAGEAGLAGDSGGADIMSIVITVINAVLSFVGVIFLILMIYAGFLWMTARGDAGQVKTAKTMITQAVIGMIVIFAAYAITDFVLGNVIGF